MHCRSHKLSYQNEEEDSLVFSFLASLGIWEAVEAFEQRERVGPGGSVTYDGYWGTLAFPLTAEGTQLL